MTESQVQYFLAVTKEMSISKAANLLYVSQPAVSKQVSLLEEELGVPLFRRINNRLEITEAGRAYEKLFSDFFLRLRETKESTLSACNELSGTYRLGCIEGWDLASFYPELQDYLRAKYPNVEIVLCGYNLDQIRYALRRGEIDGAIAPQALFQNDKDVEADAMTQVGSLLLYSSKHPLARKKDLRFSDFRSFPFLITVPAGMKNAADELISICRSHGFTPQLEYTNTISAAYMKIRATTAVLLTTDWIMAKTNPIFGSLRIPAKRDIGLITLPNRNSELVQTISEKILDFFDDEPKHTSPVHPGIVRPLAS